MKRVDLNRRLARRRRTRKIEVILIPLSNWRSPMPQAWVPLLIPVAALAAAGLYLLGRWSKPLCYANSREERLTRKLARVVGCSLEQALPAIQREVNIAPNQSDETLVKRAAYHYRQELPERFCPVYRDQA